MKHEDIYYTCDRCGRKIKNIIPNDYFGLRNKMELTEEQIAERYKNSSGKIMCTVGFDIKSYDLCPVCKKELKKFLAMKEKIL